jgi:hypothetical protein
MYELSFTMKMKSVMAGLYAARARPHDEAELRHHPAGQHIALENLGIAAKAGHAFLNARAAAVVQPMTGAPTFMAMSMILQIFIAWRSETAPPNTVKSCENTKTRRPLIVPSR